jgi:hypothetical protein
MCVAMKLIAAGDQFAKAAQVFVSVQYSFISWVIRARAHTEFRNALVNRPADLDVKRVMIFHIWRKNDR